MSAFIGAALRAGRAGRGLLPTGQLLTPEVWARRHRGIVWLLWLHVAGITVFALARATGLGHALQEASLVAVFALAAAAHPGVGRRARSAAAVLGLISSSAAIVHLSGGVSRPPSTSAAGRRAPCLLRLGQGVVDSDARPFRRWATLPFGGPSIPGWGWPVPSIPGVGMARPLHPGGGDGPAPASRGWGWPVPCPLSVARRGGATHRSSTRGRPTG